MEINKNVPEPDVVIFLDVPPENALKRVYQRDGENIKFEEKDSQVFQNVRQNFLDVLPKQTLILDSIQDMNTIHEKIVNHIQEKMKEGN